MHQRACGEHATCEKHVQTDVQLRSIALACTVCGGRQAGMLHVHVHACGHMYMHVGTDSHSLE